MAVPSYESSASRWEAEGTMPFLKKLKDKHVSAISARSKFAEKNV
jgi:hypothetical protein